MRGTNRYLLHTCFWLIYFCITLFNELFLTSGRDEVLTTQLFFRTFFSEIFLLTLKIGFTYLVLYYFLPAWLKSANRSREVIKIILATSLFTLLYRIAIQYISWPFLLGVNPVMSLESVMARYFYSLFEVLQILGIGMAIKLLRLKMESSRQEKELLKEKMGVELIRLKAQIHPHFLFNVLNSMYSYSRNNTERTSEMILKLSDLLRFMIYESENKLVTITDELRVIEHYIELQLTRFDGKVFLERTIEIDDRQAAISPLLLFPLIENAFKHGVGTTLDNSVIQFELILKKSLLRVRTKNAIHENSVKNDNSGGIGLSNIKKQLGILYPDHQFELSASDGQFTATLTINLNSYVDFELHHY